jgi:hypothetical protein
VKEMRMHSSLKGSSLPATTGEEAHSPTERIEDRGLVRTGVEMLISDTSLEGDGVTPSVDVSLETKGLLQHNALPERCSTEAWHGAWASPDLQTGLATFARAINRSR